MSLYEGVWRSYQESLHTLFLIEKDVEKKVYYPKSIRKNRGYDAFECSRQNKSNVKKYDDKKRCLKD
jgi:hypothetical protein